MFELGEESENGQAQSMPMLGVAGTIAGLISPSKTVPWPVKWPIGILSGILLYGYLLFAGREKKQDRCGRRNCITIHNRSRRRGRFYFRACEHFCDLCLLFGRKPVKAQTSLTRGIGQIVLGQAQRKSGGSAREHSPSEFHEKT